MNPFVEIVSKKGVVASINLNYIIRFEPHGPYTDIWIDSGSTETGAIYYLSDMNYDVFKDLVDNVLLRQK